ncbi:hypothetical protein [Phormidium nigroviride]
MPELLQCMECGAQLSSDAEECPHCHTEYPRGVVCLGCFETLKQSEAVKHETHNTHSTKYFHAACYHQVMKPLILDSSFSRGNFTPSSIGKTYDRKTLNALIKADAKRVKKQNSRNRYEHLKKIVSKVFTILLLLIIEFIFWAIILNLMFGEIGLAIAFIVTILLTLVIVKEM